MLKDESMSVTEHVLELRKRIILVLAVFLLSMIAGLFVAPSILLYLKGVPPASDITWNVFSPWDGIRLYMSISLIFAFTVTLPFILYQLWKFVKNGLHIEEQDTALKYIPIACGCFIIGLCFAYFVVFPMSFTFTSSISSKLQLIQTYGVAQYFGFMFSIVLPLALVFELPVIVMFLTKIKVMNPKRLHAMRRYAYLILVIVASLISPPELLSHLMVAVPMMILYEISLWLSHLVYRKQTKLASTAA